ncbi:hypothetical protein OPQ81_000785 [Rhizoctonia solani]|nr:hypothetical protein OPQ81_000785 [Rhizoctonia solani]
MYDLKSPEGVIEYLKGTRFAASHVQRLSGGYSAFTYRVTLQAPLKTGEKTIVIKHYEGFCARMEKMRAEAKRAEYEYKALSAVAESRLFDSASIVQFPRPIENDQDTHTIFMHDIGSTIPLTQVLDKGFPHNESSGSTATYGFREKYELASYIGGALGDFLGCFHNWSALPEQAALRAYFGQHANRSQAIVSSRLYFLTLATTRFKLHESWMDELIAKEEQEASMDGGVLVMGDCTFQNILISPPSGGRDMRIYLTDLEVARASYPEVDIGALTASAISFRLLYYPRVDYPFVAALHQAYSRHRTLDPRRIGIATGVELIGFGSLFLGPDGQDETKARNVVVEGVKLLNFSINKDEDSIKSNPVVQNLFIAQS